MRNDRRPVRAAESVGQDAPTIGARLRAARLAQGLSTHRVGLWLGRSNAIVCRWELAQREPTLWDLDRLAAVLRFDLDSVLADLPPTGIARRCSSRAHSWARRRALGAVFARRRRLAGLDLWDVMETIGIDTRRLAMIEGGADPGLDEAIRLIRLYRMTPSELLREAKAALRAAILDNRRASPTVPGSHHGQPPGCDGSGA